MPYYLYFSKAFDHELFLSNPNGNFEGFYICILVVWMKTLNH